MNAKCEEGKKERGVSSLCSFPCAPDDFYKGKPSRRRKRGGKKKGGKELETYPANSYDRPEKKEKKGKPSLQRFP